MTTSSTTTLAVTSAVPTSTTTVGPTSTTAPAGRPRPDWLSTRPLPLRPDGFGEAQPTPVELADRRLETIDLLAPSSGDGFQSGIEAVPDEVLARSTWKPGCPVGIEELSYVTVSFFGFDRRFHTGELVVNAAEAEDIVEVFRQLHAARFPIEEMRVTTAAELEAPRTGDGNNTTALVCRAAVGSNGWSQHAFGLAIDLNPFHNPYLKGDLVLPELASAYLDRENDRPGMIGAGDVVTAAFAGIGWGWGGDWTTLKDYQHFSASGR